MATGKLMKVRLTYYTGTVFRLYPQIPPIWIDAYWRKYSHRAVRTNRTTLAALAVFVNSNHSNLCCQSPHGHLEAQRRQIEVRARRNQKYYGHLRPSQR